MKYISCDCKSEIDYALCNSNQKRNNKTCQFKSKNDHKCIKHNSWEPCKCIYENGKYLKSMFDKTVIMCNENINIRNSITNVTNTCQ